MCEHIFSSLFTSNTHSWCVQTIFLHLIQPAPPFRHTKRHGTTCRRKKAFHLWHRLIVAHIAQWLFTFSLFFSASAYKWWSIKTILPSLSECRRCMSHVMENQMDEQIHLNRRVHRKTIIRYTAHEPIINNPEMKVERNKSRKYSEVLSRILMYNGVCCVCECVFGVRPSISPLMWCVCAHGWSPETTIEARKKSGAANAWTKCFSNVVLDAIRKLVRCTTHIQGSTNLTWCGSSPADTLLFGASHFDENSWQLYCFGSIHFALFATQSFCFFLFLLLFQRCLCTRTINNPSVKSAWIMRCVYHCLCWCYCLPRVC